MPRNLPRHLDLHAWDVLQLPCLVEVMLPGPRQHTDVDAGLNGPPHGRAHHLAQLRQPRLHE